jgi:ankyrin repeat protein
MVDRGADVNGRAIGSMMPIHSAAGSGALDVVRYLLSRGADPKADDGGLTALHMGARNPEIVRILLDAGIDKDARTHRGMTPLAFAHDWPFATKRSGAGGARVLIAAGANVNAADAAGQTPFFHAVMACDEVAAMEMLRAGADINARTREGRTALQMSRHAAQQEGWFSRLFWFLIDPQAQEVVRYRERFEHTLLAAGAK